MPFIMSRVVMSGLVRNVYELVDPEDLKISKELAIKNYNEKLAEIYRMEENLGGLPINMDGFELFSIDETSSDPLNIAYKAAQISNPDRADIFCTICALQPLLSAVRLQNCKKF